MPRIQILELPEGAADERPPFALIIDQATEQTVAHLDLDAGLAEGVPLYSVPKAASMSLAQMLGARAVLVFEETVEIEQS